MGIIYFFKKSLLLIVQISFISATSFSMNCCMKPEESIDEDDIVEEIKYKKEEIRAMGHKLHKTILANKTKKALHIINDAAKNFGGKNFSQLINITCDDFPYYTNLMLAISYENLDIVTAIIKSAQKCLNSEELTLFIINAKPALLLAAGKNNPGATQAIIDASKCLSFWQFNIFITPALKTAEIDNLQDITKILNLAATWNNMRHHQNETYHLSQQNVIFENFHNINSNTPQSDDFK